MRPSKDETWLLIAIELSKQSTCLRRNVGCVLIDAHGEVDGTGWNGVARGEPHCNEEIVHYQSIESAMRGNTQRITHPHACPGAIAESGTNLDGCEALHAEQNALSQCTNKWNLATCYCTASPCMTCVKMLMNTSVRRIVFIEEYPHAAARTLWLASQVPGGAVRREWIQRKV
jgi:dCMP deaminase